MMESLSEGIKLNLRTKTFGKRLFLYQELEGSSQDFAKKLLKEGAEEGTVVITESQQARGRMGRKWYCPKGSGILFSVILKPGLKPAQLLQIPLIAGVAVRKAIKKATALEVGLKWVNDLILNGKKVGGILAEAITHKDSSSDVILGIGVNVNRPAGFVFPEGLEEKAAFLSDFAYPISRTQLLYSLLEELERVYGLFLEQGFSPIKEEWKKFSLTLDKVVKVIGAEEMIGWAEDIDEQGALILRLKDGSLRKIISDEVSIRTPKGGYI